MDAYCYLCLCRVTHGPQQTRHDITRWSIANLCQMRGQTGFRLAQPAVTVLLCSLSRSLDHKLV